MSDTLKRLISRHIELGGFDSFGAHADLNGEKYRLAAEAFEESIIEEICEERASEIAQRAAKKKSENELDSLLSEAKVSFLQCIFLAFFVSLLASHVFELLKMCAYQAATPAGVNGLILGGLVVFGLCLAGAILLALSYICKAVTNFKAILNCRS